MFRQMHLLSTLKKSCFDKIDKDIAAIQQKLGIQSLDDDNDDEENEEEEEDMEEDDKEEDEDGQEEESDGDVLLRDLIQFKSFLGKL